MKQLFITDLDGTLLTPQGQVSQESARIISHLSALGAAITVATARTPATVEPLLADTLTTPPAIIMTGAAIWDRRNLRYLEPRFFSKELATEAWRTMTVCGLRPFVYMLSADASVLHAYFHGEPSPQEQKFIDERTGNQFKQIHITPEAVEPTERTMLIFAMGEEKPVARAAEILRNSGCAVSAYPDTYVAGNYIIEVFAPGVSKAAAVRRLRVMTGAEHVTVFGDNLNDLPMMEVADTAVAVANAQPAVRQAADIIIGSNADDAVARYISEQCGQHIQAP